MLMLMGTCESLPPFLIVGTDGFGTCLPFDPCAGLTCDDGNACTIDTCDGAGTCRFTRVDCPAGESCNPGTGTCEAPRDLCVGLICDDGISCNGVETCDSDLGCVPGTAPSCDDGVLCTDDTCDAASDSCLNVGNDDLCDDGLFCNGEETCGSTACIAGTPPCFVEESCNEGLGECIACVHTATAENSPWTGSSSSVITHPLADGDPDAIVHVTQNWNPGGTGGTDNASPVGVWYDGAQAQWNVFNQDLVSMPLGAAFNIRVVERSGSDFLHTATSDNTVAGMTIVRHSLIDANPDAIIFVTVNWNPDPHSTCQGLSSPT